MRNPRTVVEEEEDNSVEAAMPTALIRVLLLRVYTMEASHARPVEMEWMERR